MHTPRATSRCHLRRKLPSRLLRLTCIAGALAGAAAPEASAQDTSARRYRFTADLGFVSATGNTEVTTLNVGERLAYTPGRLELAQTLSVIYGETDGVRTASLWRGGVRGDYPLSARIGAYTLVGFERDRFAGLDRRFEEGVGLTLRVIEARRDSLDLESGISLVQQRSLAGISDEFTAGRAAARYAHYFTAVAYFEERLEFLPNLERSEDYRINSETALVAPFSRALALRLGYIVRFDNEPAEPGLRKADRLFTTGIQVAF